MFDSYTVRERAVHTTQNTTIHEHRAPTDESVKILKELEKEAREKIFECFELNENILSGIVALFRQDPRTQDYFVVVKFKLNNKEYTFEDTLPSYKTYHDHTAEIVVKLCKSIADIIAEALFENIIRSESFASEHAHREETGRNK